MFFIRTCRNPFLQMIPKIRYINLMTCPSDSLYSLLKPPPLLEEPNDLNSI